MIGDLVFFEEVIWVFLVLISYLFLWFFMRGFLVRLIIGFEEEML